MKIKSITTLLTTAVAIIIIPTLGFTCTDFILKARDNSTIVGRSMEFGEILPTAIKLFNKGENIQSKGDNNQNGMQWTSKYAYLGLYNTKSQVVMDGFNEKGLSLGLLWFPGAKYPSAPNAAPNTVVNLIDVPNWILGNFATVEEAILAIPKINLFAGVVPGFAETPPVHLSLHDASGKSAVVEFIDGKVNVYDNPVGVLTNAPEFPWHVTNLRNYINLSAMNKNAINIDGTVLQPTGQGTGLLGLPGDWTPPSRFVRTAIFKQLLITPTDAKTAVLSALHLLNTVDIPYGAVREGGEGDNGIFDFTQWIVVKDLTNKKLYVRTYGNQNIQLFDLLNDAINGRKGGSQTSSAMVDLNIEIPQ